MIGGRRRLGWQALLGVDGDDPGSSAIQDCLVLLQREAKLILRIPQFSGSLVDCRTDLVIPAQQRDNQATR